ncbi:MAG: hypothetical protein MMC23_006842 [Stictis urceolatum]|nr:hypothetical protein [Stictis urceolata]
MPSGPVPTQLTLLSLLPSIPTLSKVRFLGCVESYSAQTGRLHLKHSPSETTALVDISHVEARKEDLEIGVWVNLMGYVQEQDDSSSRLAEGQSTSAPKRKVKGKREGWDGGRFDQVEETPPVVNVNIQALMLWNAGAVDVKAYEKAVEARMKVDRMLRQSNEIADDENSNPIP